MKYHALFVIFEKSIKILNCRLLQIKGGALRVNIRKERYNAPLKFKTGIFEWLEFQTSRRLTLKFYNTSEYLVSLLIIECF